MKMTQDTFVPNQRRRKSQVHGIQSLNIIRHNYNHSTVHTNQEIWHQDLINKSHSSAMSHSIHLGTGLLRHYLPGCLLSSGYMGSHHRGASANTGKKSPCKLSHVLCLILLLCHLCITPRRTGWGFGSTTAWPLVVLGRAAHYYLPLLGQRQQWRTHSLPGAEGERGSLHPASSVVSDSSPSEGCSPGKESVWRDAWGGKQTSKSFQIPLTDSA